MFVVRGKLLLRLMVPGGGTTPPPPCLGLSPFLLVLVGVGCAGICREGGGFVKSQVLPLCWSTATFVKLLYPQRIKFPLPELDKAAYSKASTALHANTADSMVGYCTKAC